MPPPTKQVRIVGGQEAKRNSIPWQASLRYRTEKMAFCGGSIVTPDRVVTAAHCVMDEPKYHRDSANSQHSVSVYIFSGFDDFRFAIHPMFLKYTLEHTQETATQRQILIW